VDESQWKALLHLASVPLRKLDSNRRPLSAASGCLVDYHGKRLVLTVQHATGDMGNWAIEIRYEPGRGTQLYQIGSMDFLKVGNLLSGTVSDVDFSYASVPGDLQPMQQQFGVRLSQFRSALDIEVRNIQ